MNATRSTNLYYFQFPLSMKLSHLWQITSFNLQIWKIIYKRMNKKAGCAERDYFMPDAINKKTSLAHDPVTFPKQTNKVVYVRRQNRFQPIFVNVFYFSLLTADVH